MALTCGQLRNRVSIKRRQEGQDALGQPLQTWVLVRELWAEVRQQTGLEAIRANAEVSIVKASIRVRRCSDISAGMRAEHGSTVYDIEAVLQDEQHRQATDLVCRLVQ